MGLRLRTFTSRFGLIGMVHGRKRQCQTYGPTHEKCADVMAEALAVMHVTGIQLLSPAAVNVCVVD